MTRRLHTGGYVYGSDPNTPLERTGQSTDRFTVAAIALILALFFGAAGFAMFPAASDATTASASHAQAIEAGQGKDLGR